MMDHKKAPHPASLLCSSTKKVLSDPAKCQRFVQEVTRLCSSSDSSEARAAAVEALFNGMACELAYMTLSLCCDDPGGTLLVMHAITTLAEGGYRDPNHRLGAAEGPYRLCRVIDRHASNLDVVLTGFETIAAVTTADAATMQGLLEEAGALVTVQRALRGFYASDTRVWLPGLRCMRALLKRNLDTNNDFAMELVGLIVDMLRTCNERLKQSPDFQEIQRFLCQTVADLVTDAATARAFLEQSVPRYLCILLTKCRADEDVQLSGCRAVLNLAMHEPAARVFLGDYMPALFKRMLETHKASTDILEVALRTATALCYSNEKNAELLGANGMCEVVVEALRLHVRKEAIVVEAARALGAMSFVCQENVSRFCKLNAQEALELCKERHAKTETVFAEVRLALQTVSPERPPLSGRRASVVVPMQAQEQARQAGATPQQSSGVEVALVSPGVSTSPTAQQVARRGSATSTAELPRRASVTSPRIVMALSAAAALNTGGNSSITTTGSTSDKQIARRGSATTTTELPRRVSITSPRMVMALSAAAALNTGSNSISDQQDGTVMAGRMARTVDKVRRLLPLVSKRPHTQSSSTTKASPLKEDLVPVSKSRRQSAIITSIHPTASVASSCTAMPSSGASPKACLPSVRGVVPIAPLRLPLASGGEAEHSDLSRQQAVMPEQAPALSSPHSQPVLSPRSANNRAVQSTPRQATREELEEAASKGPTRRGSKLEVLSHPSLIAVNNKQHSAGGGQQALETARGKPQSSLNTRRASIVSGRPPAVIDGGGQQQSQQQAQQQQQQQQPSTAPGGPDSGNGESSSRRVSLSKLAALKAEEPR